MSPNVGMAIREEFVLAKILQKGAQGPTKVHFPHIQICTSKDKIVIMNDLEQSMLSYYVTYFEKFRKIIQQTEKEPLKNACFEMIHKEWFNLSINSLLFPFI